jgi:VWFA-related protein
MKRKFLIALAILIVGFTVIAQDIQHDAISINIEVPVRVFKGNTFVNDLAIGDFEVYEDGILQKIEAVYLIERTSIERAESPEKKLQVSAPQLNRHFLFQFEITDYMPRIKEALDEFFLNVIQPGDTLIVVTPLKIYNLKDGAFSRLPRDKMAELLDKKVHEDVVKGNADYHSLIKELSSPLNSPELTMNILRQLRDYKKFDEQGLLQTASYLDGLEGQKHIFLFYQKEGIPISRDMDIFNKFELIKSISFDEDRVKEAFSDSSISVHFLYITKDNSTALDVLDPRSMRNREILDQSAPIYGAFKEMAQVTGGISESSTNIAWSFNQAVQASENYYLLYYSPKNYTADGKFKKIEVKVKGQNYRLTHRSGYIAD